MSRMIQLPEDVSIIYIGVLANQCGCKMKPRQDGSIEFVPDSRITDRPAHFRKMVQKRREKK